MKVAILIVGMHRSGTSALTGVINILGAYLGEDISPPAEDNPKGFFENKSIFNLNEYILSKKLNSSWDDPHDAVLRVLVNHESLISELKPLIEYVLESVFGGHPLIAIKDPRICLLLPLYKSALIKLGYDVKYVQSVRDEYKIVKSLIARNGFEEDVCRALIRKYLYHLESAMIKESRVVVKFDHLINNTQSVISKLQHELPFLNYSEDNLIKVNEFLDKSLKHH